VKSVSCSPAGASSHRSAVPRRDGRLGRGVAPAASSLVTARESSTSNATRM
jgi:hypothetical protein